MARSLFDDLDIEWQLLSRSTAAKRALRSWDVGAFAGFRTLDALVNQINKRGAAERSDELLREVIKLSATDDLACRTALQCMWPTMRSLTWRYRVIDERCDVEGAVVVETLEKIRRYPIESRPVHIAANIARDVQHVFWQARRRIVDVEPVDPVRLGHHRSVTRSESHEVATLLYEGIRSGRVTGQEAALIFATRVLDEPISDLARRAGIHPQSVRKRRSRAEAKLEAVCVER